MNLNAESSGDRIASVSAFSIIDSRDPARRESLEFLEISFDYNSRRCINLY